MRNHFDPLPVQAAPDPHTRRPTNPQAPLDQPGRSHAPSSALACLAVCLLTALLVFALPFAVPVHSLPTISAPFVAGFSNRAAILSAAAIGVAVLVWSWRRPSPPTTASAPQAVDAHQLRPALIGVVVLATCLLFAIAGSLVARSHLRYIADAGYFIEQMSSHAEFGRSLYTELEFAYGPLLFYPTVLLHRLLHTGWLTAYLLILMLDASLGLVLLAYVLNALPIHGHDRRFGFILLAIGALNPLLGLNYTLLRFLAPFAILLFGTRSPSLTRTTLLFAAGEILLLGISPELGFAFLIATLASTGLNVWSHGARWLLLITAPVVGATVFLLLAGKPYLRMLNSFSHGALNLPVAPYPHILVFLFALVWLVPRALGVAFRQNPDESTRLLAFYALGLAFLYKRRHTPPPLKSLGHSPAPPSPKPPPTQPPSAGSSRSTPTLHTSSTSAPPPP